LLENKFSQNSSERKLANIIEALGIFDEKGLSKDWLLSELKRHHIKSTSPRTANTSEILSGCSIDGIKKILNILKQEDFSIKDLKTLTKTLHWFFIDMVASTDPTVSVKAQARKIYALNTIIETTEIFKKNDLHSLVILPTGDGMAIGFPDSAEKPVLLAIELHKALQKYNKSKKEKDKVLVRIGIDTGPVYFMMGLGGGKIFWGPGIIMAKRVMDLCGPNQILASERIAKDLRRLSEEHKTSMHSIGKYNIKHGDSLEIFNIYGKNFGTKYKPKESLVSKKPELNYKKPDFEFNTVEIRLDVTDPTTMMTRHTWIWEVKNTSEKLLDKIFYDIGGEISKDFADLNMKITDGNNKKLDIASLEKNTGLEKKFFVALKKPLRRNQKGIVKIQYDWEEPERSFLYVFSSKCKKFRYVFTMPKGVEIKSRILEVVSELGLKKRAEPTPTIKHLKDKTEVIWETAKNHKVNQHDAFEFQW